MEKEKIVKKNIGFSERHIQMANDIAEKEGWRDFTAVIHAALAFKHSKTMPPDYIINRSSARSLLSGKNPPTAEEVAKARVSLKHETEKAIQNQKEIEKENICVNVFKGKVSVTASGSKVCKFMTRHTNEIDDMEQQIPLMQCDPIIAKNNLFIPTKESVLLARPKLKKIYES